MRTSFHHQSEAQHPKSSAIHKYAGRLPHLMTQSGRRTQSARGHPTGAILTILAGLAIMACPFESMILKLPSRDTTDHGGGNRRMAGTYMK